MKSPAMLSSLFNYNHNVLYTLLYKFSDGVAQGVWSAASMATYIYLLENNSTKYVGLAQGIQGTFVAISAIPAGWLADRFRRDRVLKCCAVASCGAIACTTAAVLLPQDRTVCVFGMAVDHKYLWLCFALALWGLGQGAGPVVEALLADSTRTGSRSKVYSIMFSAGLAGMSIGPCAAAATFAVTGNAWHVQTLQHVILVGMVLAVIPILALLCFDDDHSLGAESNAVRHQPTPTRSPVSGKTAGQRRPRQFRSLSKKCVPYFLASSDVLFGLASGMTIKFFPIFFLKQVALPPIGTNFILAGTPLCVAVMSQLASPIAHLLGRVPTILLLKLIGVNLMGFMGMFPEIWTKLGVIIPVYVIRTAIINSAAPLQKSILMDYVPKESRARWNSLDGVLIFGWSGSAFLGGILIEKFGFDFTFCITALVQGIGACFLIPLLLLVPRKEAAHQPSDSVSTAAVAAAGSTSGFAATDTEVLADGQMSALDALEEEAAEVADLEQPLLSSQSTPKTTSLNYLGNSPARGSLDL